VSYTEIPEMAEPRIRLAARADDAGSCHTANVAIREVADAGLALNVGVMAPCPFFDEAAAMLAGRSDLCIGLHATVTAEWDAPKWGPVLPPDRVPSLVDADGHFHPNANALHERGANPDEVLAELEAQLERARAAGLAIAYLDEHMGFAWLPGVGERLAGLVRREGLWRGRVPGLPAVSGAYDDVAEEFIARLEAAAPGTYLVVGHPGHDTEEMRRLVHPGLRPGQVAREREGDTRRFTAPEVLGYCRSRGVEPVRLADLPSG
jgi:predicted glycoside hydrolase/deacetylase ChbG (UPF0249 family)